MLLQRNACVTLAFQVTTEILNQLISKIQQEMADADSSEDTTMIKVHFDNTVLHVKKRIDPAASAQEDD